MVRVGVVVGLWLVAGVPVLVRWLRRVRVRRDVDVVDVLARVVAGPERPARSRSRSPAVVRWWPVVAAGSVALVGAGFGSELVAAGGVVALNAFTVAVAHRDRMRVVRAAAGTGRRDATGTNYDTVS